MEPTRADSPRTRLPWSVAIVVGNLIAVVWHLVLVLKVQPDFPRFVPPLLILFNLVPVAGLVAFAKGFQKLAAGVIVVPLGIALVIGIYAHFLSPGTDNIFRMPPGDLRLQFQISAVLLVFLEALGCWAGLRIFLHPSVRRALKT